VTVGLAEQFCIIEGAETMQDFARMQLKEIKENIASRRNKIFLLMEEVRRLRIQQRLKSAEQSLQEDSEDETAYPSSIPFLPPLTKTDLRQKYYVTFFSMIGAVIIFGGFFAPVLELKLGVGGTSYADFIRSLNLPIQLSQVDPIVASFSGGAVGVLSSLMIVELNNVSLQEEKKCHYCKGSGYLACAKCGGMGAIMDPVERAQLKEQLMTAGKSTAAGRQVALKKLRGERCVNCSGAGKVMCPTCLCTGMALATEHDPRIDPFD
jgi:hypothetical protein